MPATIGIVILTCGHYLFSPKWAQTEACGSTHKLPRRTRMSLELRSTCRLCTVPIPHMCGSPYSFRISSHPNPSLRWREGYYAHFTGEETRAQGSQVLTWPRAHREFSCSQVCLNSFDFSSKDLCSTWRGVGLPPPPGLGGLPPPRGTPTDRGPHRGSLFPLSVMPCPALAPLGQTLLSTALNRRPARLWFPKGQKRWMKRHCYAEVFTPCPAVWRLAPGILLPKMISLGAF